jgi:hypothetical protein
MRSKGINGKPYKRHCLTLQPWDVKFKSIVVRKKNLVVNPLIVTIVVWAKWPTTQLVDGHQQSSSLLNYQNTFACVQNCHYKEFAPFTPIFLLQQKCNNHSNHHNICHGHNLMKCVSKYQTIIFKMNNIDFDVMTTHIHHLLGPTTYMVIFLRSKKPIIQKCVSNFKFGIYHMNTHINQIHR